MRSPIVTGRRHTAALLALALLLPAAGGAQQAASSGTDPRVGLKPGWMDAGEAARNLRLVAHRDRPQGFFNPAKAGDFFFVNADLAFQGSYVFQGGYNGFQVWDVSSPANPVLRQAFACPGGQGDVSVHGNLLFMSVEEKRGRIGCGSEPFTEADTVSAERFRGVRIFDIADLAAPKQVAFVQTCRGSHTHTLVTDPKDTSVIYVYVSGTSSVRSGAELAGCSSGQPDVDPNTALFRIEVIRVPLAHPEQAKIVNSPRVFAVEGNIAGLQKGSRADSTHRLSETNQCHDVTAYPAIGLAAGACSGNGILLDITDPANPRRVGDTSDPNFSYWHSATFNNDGRKVLFTDEWGGGTQPRCRATDRPEWGADAIYTLAGHALRPAGYYKLPAAQTAQENCVAHNGNLIPVPGRDIMVQAWYQGGMSVFDFTDAAHPQEIAFFDRGPMDTTLVLGGYWSTYWYNGHIYGSEIGRGLDVFELQPSDFLTRDEIEAAKLARVDVLNPQDQQKIVWPSTFVVARAYVDGLARGDALRGAWATNVRATLARAERVSGAARRTALATLAGRLDRDAAGTPADAERLHALAAVVRDLAAGRR